MGLLSKSKLQIEKDVQKLDVIKEEKQEERSKQVQNTYEIKGQGKLSLTKEEFIDSVRYNIIKYSPLMMKLITLPIIDVIGGCEVYCDGKSIYLNGSFYKQPIENATYKIYRELVNILLGNRVKFDITLKLEDKEAEFHRKMIYVQKNILDNAIVDAILLREPESVGVSRDTVKPTKELKEKIFNERKDSNKINNSHILGQWHNELSSSHLKSLAKNDSSCYSLKTGYKGDIDYNLTCTKLGDNPIRIYVPQDMIELAKKKLQPEVDYNKSKENADRKENKSKQDSNEDNDKQNSDGNDTNDGKDGNDSNNGNDSNDFKDDNDNSDENGSNENKDGKKDKNGKVNNDNNDENGNNEDGSDEDGNDGNSSQDGKNNGKEKAGNKDKNKNSSQQSGKDSEEGEYDEDFDEEFDEEFEKDEETSESGNNNSSDGSKSERKKQPDKNGRKGSESNKEPSSDFSNLDQNIEDLKERINKGKNIDKVDNPLDKLTKKEKAYACNKLLAGDLKDELNKPENSRVKNNIQDIINDYKEDSTEGVLNEIKNNFSQEDINEMLKNCQHLQHNVKIREAFKEKLNKDNDLGIHDKPTKELEKTLEDLASHMDEELLEKFNDNCSDEGLRTPQDILDNLDKLVDEDLLEEVKDTVQNYLEPRTSEIERSIKRMMENMSDVEKKLALDKLENELKNMPKETEEHVKEKIDSIKSSLENKIEKQKALEWGKEQGESDYGQDSYKSNADDYSQQEINEKDIQEFMGSCSEEEFEKIYDELDGKINEETLLEYLNKHKEEYKEILDRKENKDKNKKLKDYLLKAEKEDKSKEKEKISGNDLMDSINNFKAEDSSSEPSNDLEDLIRDTMNRPENTMSKDDYQSLLTDMHNQLESMRSNGFSVGGNIGSRILNEYEGLYKSETVWYKKAKQMIESFKTKSQSSYAKPNKKYLKEKYILQSKCKSQRTDNIDKLRVWLDSSGSMSKEDFMIFKSIIHSAGKLFPRETEAFEFNTVVLPMKVVKGKIIDEPRSSGGTEIKCVLSGTPKTDCGKVLSIIVSDGQFSWKNVLDFMISDKRCKFLFIITKPLSKRYEDEVKLIESKFNNKRFLMVQVKGVDKDSNKINWG